MAMTVTLTKEFLASFMTTKGIPKIVGVFKAAITGSYTTGGAYADTSPYFKTVDMAIPLNTEDASGYVYQIDDGSYSAGKFKIEMLVGDVGAAGTAVLTEVANNKGLGGILPKARMLVIGS